MANIPSKIGDRIVSCLKRFHPVLSSAKARDVNESDTVIIVTDMLSEVFGFDKYSEVTSEHAIRGTFCDLAISIEGKVQFLIEVKAIGLELKDAHVKQAVDYAANKGVDWVLLTNGTNWRVYKITFAKPIDQELVAEIDFLAVNPKTEDEMALIFMLTKEGWLKQVLGSYHEQKQALNRFFLGAMILTDSVLDVIRRELKRACPDVKIHNEQIQNVLLQEVLKREVVEGEKAEEARKKVARAASRQLRNRSVKEEPSSAIAPPSTVAAVPQTPDQASPCQQPTA